MQRWAYKYEAQANAHAQHKAQRPYGYLLLLPLIFALNVVRCACLFALVLRRKTFQCVKIKAMFIVHRDVDAEPHVCQLQL